MSLSDTISTLWYYGLETPLSTIGLMQRPMLRFGLFATGAYLAVRWMKPEAFYDPKTQEPYPSVLIDNTNQEAVVIDDKTFSLLVGLSSIVFI